MPQNSCQLSRTEPDAVPPATTPNSAPEVPPGAEITALLGAWSEGDARALDRLMPLLTDELRRLARSFLRRQPVGHTLQPTALVNELYIRLAGRQGGRWPDRARFFAFAAATMRHLLVDHARARRAAKRGAGQTPVALHDELDGRRQRLVDLIALDEALGALARLDPRQSRIVELRAFAGLSLKETAECLEVSEATVSRDWAMAKAWLFRQLTFRPAS